MLNYHDVRTLHYLSQGAEPKESVPQLQSHFEAWKVRCLLMCSAHVACTSILLCLPYVLYIVNSLLLLVLVDMVTIVS